MSQWTHLLKNLGIWEGSFTHFSNEGIKKSSVPSRVSLEGLDNNRTVSQVVQMLSADRQTVVSERNLRYQTLSRSILVFESGAFSQGSMQYGPFSDFGAELGFIWGDRRCRLVQLFDKDSQLSAFTLIREYRQGADTDDLHQLNARPLKIDDLVGDWRGTATTLYPDWSPDSEAVTQMVVQKEGDRLIETSTTSPATRQWHIRACPSVSATGSTTDSTPITLLEAGQASQQLRAILFPGGVMSTTPQIIPKREAFNLEATWYVTADHRQRMIRQYNHTGAWNALTLVDERRVV
ncbi:MAG: DUF3598 family protein [Cyanobacteria bacterium J06627_8]